MSLETELMARIQSLCPNVNPVVAGYDTPRPYVVWQHVGGTPVQAYDGTLADRRNALIQITTWASTTKQAYELARSIAQALCVPSATWAGSPMGEPVDAYDDAAELCGAVQTFSAWGS